MTASHANIGAATAPRPRMALKGQQAARAGLDPTLGDGDGVVNEILIGELNCIACHHRDPSKDGGLGPPVAGAALSVWLS